MNTTRTIALAALTALSLGIGTAMAQEGPTVSLDQMGYSPAVPTGQTATPSAMPQAGSSDVTTTQFQGQRAPDLMLDSEIVGGGAGG